MNTCPACGSANLLHDNGTLVCNVCLLNIGPTTTVLRMCGQHRDPGDGSLLSDHPEKRVRRSGVDAKSRARTRTRAYRYVTSEEASGLYDDNDDGGDDDEVAVGGEDVTVDTAVCNASLVALVSRTPLHEGGPYRGSRARKRRAARARECPEDTVGSLSDIVFAYLAVRGFPAFEHHGARSGHGTELHLRRLRCYWSEGGTLFPPLVVPDVPDTAYSHVQRTAGDISRLHAAVTMCCNALVGGGDGPGLGFGVELVSGPEHGVNRQKWGGGTVPIPGTRPHKRAGTGGRTGTGLATRANVDALVTAVIAILVGGDCSLTLELMRDVRVFLRVGLGMALVRTVPSHMDNIARAPIISMVGMTHVVRQGLGTIVGGSVGGTATSPPDRVPATASTVVTTGQSAVVSDGWKRYGATEDDRAKYHDLFHDAVAEHKYRKICKAFYDQIAEALKVRGSDSVGCVGAASALVLPHFPVVLKVDPGRIDSVATPGPSMCTVTHDGVPRVAPGRPRGVCHARWILSRPLFQALRDEEVPDSAAARRLLLGAPEVVVAGQFQYATLPVQFQFLVNLLGVVDEESGHAFVTCPLATACGCVLSASASASAVVAGEQPRVAVFTTHFLYVLYRMSVAVVMPPGVAVETYGAAFTCILAWLLLPGTGVAPTALTQPRVLARGCVDDGTDDEDSARAIASFRACMDALPRIVGIVMAVFNCKARGVMEFAQAAILAMCATDGPHRGFVEAHLPQLVGGAPVTDVLQVPGTASTMGVAQVGGPSDGCPVF
jgi:hypothetical protein